MVGRRWGRREYWTAWTTSWTFLDPPLIPRMSRLAAPLAARNVMTSSHVIGSRRAQISFLAPVSVLRQTSCVLICSSRLAACSIPSKAQTTAVSRSACKWIRILGCPGCWAGAAGAGSWAIHRRKPRWNHWTLYAPPQKEPRWGITRDGGAPALASFFAEFNQLTSPLVWYGSEVRECELTAQELRKSEE